MKKIIQLPKKNKRGDYRGMYTKIKKGVDNPHWKGGIHNRKDGYVLVRRGVIKRSVKGTRYTLLHRLVVEKFLGRKLLQREVVHHKDGNKSNNDISNLEIMTQAKHAKIHYKADKKTGRYIK